MNDILQQIMNMIENTRTVPSISSFSMIGFTVLLIFGVINCILGYRLLRFWMMLCGFVIGAGIGFGAAYTGGVTEKYMYAVFMVGAGVLLAVIAFVSYKIGIFILGAGIGQCHHSGDSLGMVPGLVSQLSEETIDLYISINQYT